MELIDKDAVIAEIERLQDSIKATAIDDRISKEQAEAYRVCVKLRSFIEDNLEVKIEEDLIDIFPELKELKDERIRKELIFYLGDMPEDTELRNGVTNRDVLTWLEKQSEKSTWSEEDERLYKLSVENLTELMHRFGEEYGKVGDCINWFKSIKDRFFQKCK